MKRCVFSLLVAFGCAACVTPVIPLPPPDPTRMTVALEATSKDRVTLGNPPTPALGGSYVFVLNVDASAGVIVRAQAVGSFQSPPFAASEGHRLNLWTAQSPDDQPSEVACAVLRLAAGRLDRCP